MAAACLSGVGIGGLPGSANRVQALEGPGQLPAPDQDLDDTVHALQRQPADHPRTPPSTCRWAAGPTPVEAMTDGNVLAVYESPKPSVRRGHVGGDAPGRVALSPPVVA